MIIITALLIIGGILLLIMLLLCSHLVVQVRLTKALRIKVGILGIYVTLISPEKAHKKAAAKARETPKQKEKREQKERKKEQKKERKQALKASSRSKKKTFRNNRITEAQTAPPPKTFPETVSFVLDLIRAVLPPVGGMLRHFKLTNLDLNISVGGQDAAKTALTFVKISTAVHQTCAILATQIHVQIKQIDIRPNFCSEKIQQDISFSLNIRLIRIIVGGLVILYNVVIPSLTDKSNSKTGTNETPPNANNIASNSATR